MDRLAMFVNPESDAEGSGFQIIQLLVALGSGGPLGLGWGEGKQKFFYVPGSHTDGVFAILGEEVGLHRPDGDPGAVRVLRLPRRPGDASLARPVLNAAVHRNHQPGFRLQTLINIGGITRTIPLTGVPLPFLSYGGSSLIMLMAAVGVLLSVSRYSSNERPETRTRAGEDSPQGRAGEAAGIR